jgi:(p)ppGpp synthase/HD superfamily hydrolase
VIFIDMPGFTREDFEDVYSTAQMAHMGQIRRDGSEYFTHPSEVRNIVRKYYPSDYAAQMVALLHDSLEDAPGSTVGSIEEMESFIRGSISDPNSGQEVIDAVRNLTHTGGDYGAYVSSLLGKPLELKVKFADMLHNLSTSPSPKQRQKYGDALTTVSDSAGGIPTGIDIQHWDDLTALAESFEDRALRLLVREYMSVCAPTILQVA